MSTQSLRYRLHKSSYHNAIWYSALSIYFIALYTFWFSCFIPFHFLFLTLTSLLSSFSLHLNFHYTHAHDTCYMYTALLEATHILFICWWAVSTNINRVKGLVSNHTELLIHRWKWGVGKRDFDFWCSPIKRLTTSEKKNNWLINSNNTYPHTHNRTQKKQRRWKTPGASTSWGQLVFKTTYPLFSPLNNNTYNPPRQRWSHWTLRVWTDFYGVKGVIKWPIIITGLQSPAVCIMWHWVFYCLLKFGDICHHGFNTNHVVKVKELVWSWLKETNVNCRIKKTGNQQRSPVWTRCLVDPLLRESQWQWTLEGWNK